MGKKGYRPPYTISDVALDLVVKITELLTRQSAGGKKKIHETLFQLNPYSKEDMLKLHENMIKEQQEAAGIFRKKGVGAWAGKRFFQLTPPAKFIPRLVDALLEWIQEDTAHPLIKSSVFHYEIEFMHPFDDGNGRIGRMWQSLLLYQWNPIFGELSLEELIQENKEEYYKVLREADRVADSGIFIEFMLHTIFEVLEKADSAEKIPEQVSEQVIKVLEALGDKELSTKEMMEILGLKHRPTFRDNYLLPALKLELVEMTIPDKPNSSRQRYRKKAKIF